MDLLAPAKNTFTKAKTFEAAEKAATQWLAYIDGKEQRRAYMAAH